MSFIFRLLIFFNFCIFVDKIQATIEPIKIFLAVLDNKSQKLQKLQKLQELQELQVIGKTISRVLENTGQFTVKFKPEFRIRTKKDITNIFNLGFSLAIFLSKSNKSNNYIDYRVYDTADELMIHGKRIKNNKIKTLNNTRYIELAYNICDLLWNNLMSEKSSFAGKLAYIKQIYNSNGKKQTAICVCDYDGSNKKEILNSTNDYVGLYWNTNLFNPKLFCSEFTPYNVRLTSITLDKTKSIIWDFNGTCVGVSLSPDNNQVVYCRSGDIWFYKYNKDQKKGQHVNLISNNGKNIYPTLLTSGDIIFCSDSQSLLKSLFKNNSNISGPQICYYNSGDKTIDLITNGGYCIAPSYCYTENKLAYSKRINGFLQLFTYDFSTKKHMQLTFDKSNKIDSSWSACGKYLVFCYRIGKISRIAKLDVNTRKYIFITNDKDYCSSPSYSPLYY